MAHNKRKHLIHLGVLGFPIGTAPIEKVRLLSIGLIANGFDVTVISRYGIFNKDRPVDIKPKGVFEKINYVFASGTVYRSNNFLIRNTVKFFGFIREFMVIFRFRLAGHLDYAIYHGRKLDDMIYYKLLSLVFRFKFIYLFVEYNMSMAYKQTILVKINDYLFERIGFKIIDGALPISKLLTDYLLEKAPGKPYLKIPVICDFSKFEDIKKEDDPVNFLYCGAIGYSEVIYFILKCFESLETRENVFLYLIIGLGDHNNERMDALKNYISNMKKRDYIKIFSNLPYSELVQMYVNATALLIPLRPTLRDEARFPHKIGEYLASGNPLITNNIGEIKYYFADEENALIAKEYTIEEYIGKMEFVLKNPGKAQEIGIKGKELGLKNFDCMMYGRLLSSFLVDLKTNAKSPFLKEKK